jgi:hypothetical protein
VQLDFLQLASLLGLGSLLSAVLGAGLKWYFDHRTRQTEVFMRTFERFSTQMAEYYMPMAVSAGRIARLLEQSVRQKPRSLEYAFYTLARFQMYILRYIIHGGGYLMRDQSNERIQANLYLTARQQMPFTTDEISLMQLVAQECDEFILFYWKLTKPNKDSIADIQLCQVFQTFTNWIENEKRKVGIAARHLRCYSERLLSIIMSMYRGWYKKPDKSVRPISPPCTKMVKKIQQRLEKHDASKSQVA